MGEVLGPSGKVAHVCTAQSLVDIWLPATWVLQGVGIRIICNNHQYTLQPQWRLLAMCTAYAAAAILQCMQQSSLHAAVQRDAAWLGLLLEQPLWFRRGLVITHHSCPCWHSPVLLTTVCLPAYMLGRLPLYSCNSVTQSRRVMGYHVEVTLTVTSACPAPLYRKACA